MNTKIVLTGILKSNDEEAINDALFYRDVNYIIHIPKNFREDFLKGKNPKIKIKTTKDYNSVLAENLLNNYIKTANIFLNNTNLFPPAFFFTFTNVPSTVITFPSIGFKFSLILIYLLIFILLLYTFLSFSLT